MRRLELFAIATVLIALSPAIASAQTLYDVEHARGNYRAGLVSEFDADLVRTWGAPSGNYPAPRAVDAVPSQPRASGKRRVRTATPRARRAR